MRRTRRRGVGHEAEGGQAVVLILLVVLVMGVGGWVAAYAGANGKVPRGTTVAGIEIGGRDRIAAAAALARGLHTPAARTRSRSRSARSPPRSRPRTPASRSTTSPRSPRRSARAAGTRAQLWRYYSGGDEIAPVVQRRLAPAGRAARRARRAGRPAGPRRRHLALRRPDRPHQAAQNGVQIDQRPRPRGAGRQLRRGPHDGPAAAAAHASPTWTQADLDTALTHDRQPGRLRPGHAGLRGLAGDARAAAVRRPAQPRRPGRRARPRRRLRRPRRAGRPRRPGHRSRSTRPSRCRTARPPWSRRSPARPTTRPGSPRRSSRASPPTAPPGPCRSSGGDDQGRPSPPRTPSSSASTEPVASFTVSVPSTVGPSFADAVDRLSGALLRPGDTFSFNGRVGVVNGSAARLATATWNAGFLAGLTDVARTASPTYADGLPEGRDAMVDAATDLQMRNDSSYGVLLSARASDSGLGRGRRLVDQGVRGHRVDRRAATRRRRAPPSRRRPGLRRRAPARTASRSTWCAR